MSWESDLKKHQFRIPKKLDADGVRKILHSVESTCEKIRDRCALHPCWCTFRYGNDPQALSWPEGIIITSVTSVTFLMTPEEALSMSENKFCSLLRLADEWDRRLYFWITGKLDRMEANPFLVFKPDSSLFEISAWHARKVGKANEFIQTFVNVGGLPATLDSTGWHHQDDLHAEMIDKHNECKFVCHVDWKPKKLWETVRKYLTASDWQIKQVQCSFCPGPKQANPAEAVAIIAQLKKCRMPGLLEEVSVEWVLPSYQAFDTMTMMAELNEFAVTQSLFGFEFEGRKGQLDVVADEHGLFRLGFSFDEEGDQPTFTKLTNIKLVPWD